MISDILKEIRESAYNEVGLNEIIKECEKKINIKKRLIKIEELKIEIKRLQTRDEPIDKKEEEEFDYTHR